MQALVETMPLTAGQDMMLLYRARSRDDLVFRTELDALAASRRARVVYLLGSAGVRAPARSCRRSSS